MERLHSRFSLHNIKRKLLWAFFDSIIIISAYVIITYSGKTTAELDLQHETTFMSIALLVTLVSLYIHGVYRRIWSRTSGHGIVSILRAVILSLVILSIIDVILFGHYTALHLLAITHVIIFGGLVVARYRSRLVGAFEWRWRAIWQGEFPESDTERVLIVGAGESGQTVAMRLQHRINHTSYKVMGFVDDDPDKYDMLIEGKPVLGSTDSIPRITQEYQIELIIVAIHNIDGQTLRKIVDLCQQTEARIKIIPDVMQIMSSRDGNSSLLRDIRPEDLIGRSVVKHHEGVDLQPISGRIVLVTGAAGSIGSELCHQIMNLSPRQLIMLDTNESDLHDLHIDMLASYPDANLVPALVDVTLYKDMRSIFETYCPHVVFHAAAYKHVPMLQKYPNEAISTNIHGTLNVAELSIIHHAERFILISTDKAVDPKSVMGASKRLCEILIHCLAESDNHHTLFSAVRFGNVLGSRGSVVPTFTRQIERGGPVTVTHEEMTRFFMSISEAVNLVIHAAAMTEGDDIFVLHMGESVRILDIAERMIRLRGLRPYVDIDIQFTGIRQGEKLHEELHAYYEQPQETLHPKIVKLSTWPANDCMSFFMQEISDLINNGIPNGVEPLQYLRDVCQIDMLDNIRSA